MNFFYFYTCFNLNCNLGGSRTTFPLTAHNQLEYTLNIVHGSSALCVYKFLMQKMPETEVFRPDNCICHKRLNPFFHLSRLSLFDDIKVCADNPFTCFPYFFFTRHWRKPCLHTSKPHFHKFAFEFLTWRGS